MTPEQKTVAKGASSGIVTMALAVWGFTELLPAPSIGDAMDERIAYALRANVVALLPLFVMIITVGNSRFLSEAIDPTRHAETPAQEINGRVVENTLQQTFVFAMSSCALATVAPPAALQAVWACTIVFVIARVAFWIGYRIAPLYRAPGFAATAYLNIGMIAYVLYQVCAGA